MEKKRERLDIKDYGISKERQGMLSWSFVEEQMLDPKQYWLSTTKPNGLPHAIPIWGIWFESKLFFGGGPNTQNRKNLEHNSNIVAHTESGSNVVIIEGSVKIEEKEDVIQEIIKLYKEKYDMDHPPPFWRVDPKKVLAWKIDEFADTPTKWIFS